MRLVVIGTPGAWHVERIVVTAAARGHSVEVLEWRRLGGAITTASRSPGPVERFLPESLDQAEAVIVRGMPAGRLEEVIVRMDLLGRLAERGTPVINSPRALETAIDKYLSLCRLAAAGIRVPRTFVAQDAGGIRQAWSSLGGDAVVKPLFGSCGRGIERVASAAELAPLLTAAEASGDGVTTYLQEFIPHDGWDIRILLIGDEAFAIRRRSATDWRTNLARGALAEPCSPPADWLALARKAAFVLGVEVAGVDLLPTPTGEPVVLEVNAVPGWRGMAAAIQRDPTSTLIDWVQRRAKSPRSPT